MWACYPKSHGWGICWVDAFSHYEVNYEKPSTLILWVAWTRLPFAKKCVGVYGTNFWCLVWFLLPKHKFTKFCWRAQGGELKIIISQWMRLKSMKLNSLGLMKPYYTWGVTSPCFHGPMTTFYDDFKN